MSRAPRLSPSEFAAKWGGSTRTERAAAQEHFIDICRMLGEQTPNEADPDGDWYAFEKGATKAGGREGFADVWKRGHFAWEYKGKRKDLAAAYDQLLQYREALENPPLLVVCDLERFEVHTNYTGTKKTVHSFTLDAMRTAAAEPLRVLRAVLTDPRALRPDETPEQVTEEAARKFADLAGRLQGRGHDPLAVAHFLNRLLFCLFSEDVGLLPRGIVSRVVSARYPDDATFASQLRTLFGLMARRGGYFGTDHVQWFNGGLFDSDDVLPLDSEDRALLAAAAKLDWANIEPSILGTLFERGLDPAKRGQLGAHYTDRGSILRVVEPVVLEPLRREFDRLRSEVIELLARPRPVSTRKRVSRPEVNRFNQFLRRLRGVRVLDPACGSGNFLYVVLQKLKDLEKEAILWGSELLGIPQEFPMIGPEAVHGIEISPYAAELAKTSIWIGEIQWMVGNGFGYRTEPILQALESVECRDAILDRSRTNEPRKAEWPEAEFVVGNPPFIGGKLLRESLGSEYVDDLFRAWNQAVPREADFVCYWHEAARQQIESKRLKRAGLLATQGIRGGANQRVLKQMLESGQIFEAWQDEEWVVEGAAVRISIVCQDDGTESHRRVDGLLVDRIHADLTPGGGGSVDLTTARRLQENLEVSFMGDTKGGAFDISGQVAREMLLLGGNPNGRPNSDVVVPWANGLDVTRRPRDMFIVDFGVDMSRRHAEQYEAPYAHVAREVRPTREQNRRKAYAEKWWLHVEPRPMMRRKLSGLARYLATPRVARHRSFGWLAHPVLPDSQLIVFAREDDYFLGVLCSRLHEWWSLAKGTQLEDRPRYTPSSTFETFPFPWPLSLRPEELGLEQRRHHQSISDSASALEHARSNWLNPPDLVRREPDVHEGLPAKLLPVSEAAARQLQKRTMTQLYNQLPDWLRRLHQDLDHTVLNAYGWPADLDEAEALRRLLELNHARASTAVTKGLLHHDQH